MSYYWSNTRFADFVRGCTKPKAATTASWWEWEEKAKREHPIRYWLAEEALDKIQGVGKKAYHLWEEVGYYFYNRLVTRSHAMTSVNMKVGKYYEVETRMLEGMFGTLVQYVEVECAQNNYDYWERDGNTENKAPGIWRAIGMSLLGRRWRNPVSGINRLLWEASLICDDDSGSEIGDPEYMQPTEQAKTAMEVLALYTWWTIVRPARIDPYVDHELDPRGTGFFSRTIDKHLNRIEIEQQYEQEDEEMLLRLVKIRRSLWT